MNNVSLQGQTTLICNPTKFNELAFDIARKSKDLKPGNKYILRNCQIYSAKPNDENIVVIINNDKAGVLKYIPTGENITKLLEEIENIIDNFKEKTKKTLTAWIIGGSEIHNPNGENSIKTVNKLADLLCDRPDIDTSILACGKAPQENILIHPKSKGLELILEKSKNTTLENSFDIVELNNTEIM